MSGIKIDKVVPIVIIFTVVYWLAYSIIPALAEEPLIDPSLVEEFLSGKVDNRKTQDVIDKIQSEVKKNPLNSANYSMLAFIYDCVGSYDKALEAIKSEIKYTPEKSKWSMVYGNLAREHFNLGNIDEIKKPSIKSLRFDPRNINSRLNLLKYYILKGKYKEAGTELKILSGLDKEMDFYYEIYMCCFDKIKNKNDIIELFREAVKMNPDSPLSHRALGTAIRDLSHENMEKNLYTIMQSFKKALELNKDYIPTYISIANTYLYLGVETSKRTYFEDSLVWINKAHRMDPRNVKVAYSMGNIFLAMDEYDKGIEKLEYAFSNGGNDKDTAELLAAAYNNKAYSYYEIGKNMKEGLKMIDRAIILSPDNGLILSTKAELLYKMKRFDEAYEYIQKAVKLAPDEPGIKQDLANIEKALRTAEK
jgi:tetratricopeptide (TPR) repeat protein